MIRVIRKRWLSMLLTLAMVISLFPVVTLPAYAAVSSRNFNLLPPQESSFGGFTYSIDSINDAAVAQAPVPSTNAGLTVNEGAEATITDTLLKTTDSDTAAASITYTIGTAPIHGTLKKSGIILSAGGSFTQDDIDNSLVAYTHDGGETSADSFTFTVSDGTNILSTETFAITVTPVNDAPVIAAPASIPVTENVTMALTGISFSDADAGSGAIEAMFSVPSGTLSASTGGGVTAGGTDSALTLTGTCANINTYISGGSLFYTSAFNANGSVTLTVSGNDSGYTGGGGPQTTSTTVQLNITPRNDAPTLSGGPYMWAGTDEDTPSSSVIVSSILEAVHGQDVDGNPLGIAITGTSGSGNWEYCKDGFTWTGAGSVSNSAALLLSPSTQLRYVPNKENGETATLTFRAWDQTSETASANGIRSMADTSTNGGSTAFSTGTAQATLTVSSVNDAPTLSSGAPVLTGITTSQIGNGGQTVSSFIGTTISDVDIGAQKGIALVATAAGGGGTWQYSTDSGASWQDVGTVSEASALLLWDMDKVRFVPGGPDAATASITYRACDKTYDLQGSKVDVTANGGTTAFSTATDAASITVTADASVISVASTTANGAYKAGDTIIITVRFSKAVTVTGIPQLTLKLGTTDRTVDYLSSSGTDTLSFAYTVQPGDASSDLDYAGTGALSVNASASIQADGANVSLILPAPGSAGSLGANAALVIDGVAPTITSVLAPTDGTYKTGETFSFTVNFSEAMTVTTTDGTPHLAFTLGSAERHATYTSGSGSSSLLFSYTIQPGDNDTDGVALKELVLDEGIIKDIAGNNASTALSGVGNTSHVRVDAAAPTVSGIARQTPASEQTNASNLTFRATFSEPVEKVSADDFALAVTGTAIGTVASVSASSGSVIDVSVSGVLGDGTLRLDLKSGTDITDDAGNVTAGGYTGGEAYAIDKTAPVPGGAGIITTSEPASSSVKVTWTAATDNMTAAANLQYKVVYSLSNNIATLTDAETNGTAFGDWSTNVTSATITGLTASTGYYFNVIVKDTAGNKATYMSVTATTAGAPSGGGGDTPTGSAVVEINGEKQDAGTTNTQTTGGQTVTTITVDDAKLNKILESKGQNTTVTLPTSGNSDVTVGELTGQTVKNMETKEATLEIKTNTVTYTLPASQINIDAISSQLGSQIELKDIKVSVRIAEPPADTVKIVEDTANKSGYQIVVKPVEFEITCKSGGKTVAVSKFNSYVERTVAIPDGIDPSKITTGIVLNTDGTFRHVPTQVVKVDGKYYAKINSLTNSTYSVIWNPVKFADVVKHWAQAAINDMGSRMVVTGIGNGDYEPERSITRAEFAAIVVRAMGLTQGKTESSFVDVSLNDWFNGYIDTATAYGLITGYDANSYGPNDTITREQAMAILARAMKFTGLRINLTDSEINELISKYSDGAAVSDYAMTSVAACIKTGIMNGTTAATISPKDYVTRAEVAVMVQRLLQKSGLI